MMVERVGDDRFTKLQPLDDRAILHRQRWWVLDQIGVARLET